MKNILIYNDQGVSRSSSASIKLSLLKMGICESLIHHVDSQKLRENIWQSQSQLLIIPGGFDRYYHSQLSGKANLMIRKWVEAGGSYFGICGGSYYGAKKIVFEKGEPLEIITERELAFFPGQAIGSAYGTGVFRYHTESDSRAAYLDLFGIGDCETLTCYYNGGCYFDAAEKYECVQVLARYADIKNCPASIIQCSVGKGKAILCGVHPEYNASDLDSKKPHIQRIIPKLHPFETNRKNLLKELVFQLLDCVS